MRVRRHNKLTPLFTGLPQRTLFLFIKRTTLGDEGYLPKD